MDDIWIPDRHHMAGKDWLRACSSNWDRKKPEWVTIDPNHVTCEKCKKTEAYKEAVAKSILKR